MKPFSILVDSSCDLPPEFIQEHGIDVLPMLFTLDDREYPDGAWLEITPKEFYEKLKIGGVAKTTQINPEEWVAVFTKYAERGEDLICLVLSSGLSGSAGNAAIAADEVNERFPNSKIYAIDSLSATGGHGVLASLAVQKRSEGLSAADTASFLEKIKHQVFAFFTVDDLNFLHRGGRLSKLSAVAGSLLGVKPMLNISPEGTLQLKEKVRKRKAALELLITQMNRCLEPGDDIGRFAITHCDCEEDAKKLAGMIMDIYKADQPMIMAMSPIIGAHTGPGAITLFFAGNLTHAEYEEKYYSKK